MYYFCTYFDKNYLNKGLALYSSLKEQCPAFQLFILCMDDDCHRTLTRMQLPAVTLITREDFERDDPALREAKKNRSLIEYYFTCTPSLPLYILDRWPEVDVVTYLDSDLYFFRSPEELYREMEGRSILIIAHRFPDAIADLNIYGKYNVGYLSFRRDEHGLACLRWWRERCIEWCYDRLEGDRFADQKYLDAWPDRFPGVVVLRHKGGGLSPWNVTRYAITRREDQLWIDDQPLIFYHFHGLKKVNRWLYDVELRKYRARLPGIVRRYIYRPYIDVLEKQTRWAASYDGGKSSKVAEIRKSHAEKKNLSYYGSRLKQILKDGLNGDLIFA